MLKCRGDQCQNEKCVADGFLTSVVWRCARNVCRPGRQWACRRWASAPQCLPSALCRRASRFSLGCPSGKCTWKVKHKTLEPKMRALLPCFDTTCVYFSRGSVIFLRLFWKRMAWRSCVSILGGSRPCKPNICRSCKEKAIPWGKAQSDNSETSPPRKQIKKRIQ